MVRDGYFGFKDYFQSLCDTVDGGKDFYLLGSDFESNLEAQVIISVYLAVPTQSIYMHLEVWCCITYYGAWDLNLYDYRLLLIKHLRIQISGLR